MSPTFEKIMDSAGCRADLCEAARRGLRQCDRVPKMLLPSSPPGPCDFRRGAQMGVIAGIAFAQNEMRSVLEKEIARCKADTQVEYLALLRALEATCRKMAP